MNRKNGTMGFESVYLINDNLALATDKDVELAQGQLCLNFPKGYREYVTTLGKGRYCGNIYIAMPNPVTCLKEAENIREFWRQHFYWEGGRDVLSKRQVLESTCLGSTDNGDYLIYRQLPPRGLFALPDGDDRILSIGTDLYQALDWCCSTPDFMAPTKLRYFDSMANGVALELYNLSDTVSHQEIRQQVLSLGIHEHILRDLPIVPVLLISVKRIYGTIQVVGGRISLYYDKTRNPEFLLELVKQLNEWGYTRR